ncbi:putative chloride peroxidase [Helianthus annuus]|uniref:Chloride peroxidase n=1 Tax=Helianthus annuus TaxID=4232 RepID=A0A251S6B2_HELAN|nr:uncharacterized protein LOC110910898 [Helianthus annuus]KAF5763556.1 putative chloride peroxidase [Helianthus annuus]KAJ0450371.1 putative chloride peroxidase [Helianthus annuus]KAJ0472196.1 putative chloride peroxidase [Helianthus annuus]KAJ0647793.1 putative chloride peroxidase [Helianthus annuus]KAJ0651660.1 putative chloride peroxidase [Helianthus annuus]
MATFGCYTLTTKITKTPQAILNKMKVAYKLKQGQSRLFHQLPSGLNMEVIYQKGVQTKTKTLDEKQQVQPPLVFVHGSFHAAWCWSEHWLPFFSENGFDSYAVSLLAQGESDDPDGSVAGSLQTHAADIADFIKNQTTLSPVLIGHSFGGLIVQYYLANLEKDSSGNLAGAVLICSVPPTGNSGLVWRYLFTKPVAAYKVTMSLAAKAFRTSLPLCKETFFSQDMDDNLVLRYQELMTESSRLPLFDLRKLNASLPVASVPNPSTRVLVMGAADDFIVDAKGLEETGSFYGVQPVCVEGVAHDMMLDSSWEKGAQVMLSWIQNLDIKI